MEFEETVRYRRMIRRFDRRQVPTDVIDHILDLSRRSPTAGFSQGVDFLVLDTAESIDDVLAADVEPGVPARPGRTRPRPDRDRPPDRGPPPIPRPLLGAGQGRLRPAGGECLAGEVLGGRCVDGGDDRAARSGRRRTGWLVLRHESRGGRGCWPTSACPRASVRSASSGSATGRMTRRRSASGTTRRRRPFDEQVHRNRW